MDSTHSYFAQQLRKRNNPMLRVVTTSSLASEMCALVGVRNVRGTGGSSGPGAVASAPARSNADFARALAGLGPWDGALGSVSVPIVPPIWPEVTGGFRACSGGGQIS